MVKNNFFIITGGPGGGKTSVLNNLLLQGFSYVEKTARQIIKERLRNGSSPRPEPHVFSNEMFTADFNNYPMTTLPSSNILYEIYFN
ncbi:MAG TPA: AAA family ATPase [Puia sp.]